MFVLTMSVSLEPVCRDVLHLTRKLMRRRKATLIKVDYSPDLWSQRSCIENVICLLKLVSKSQCWAGFVAALARHHNMYIVVCLVGVPQTFLPGIACKCKVCCGAGRCSVGLSPDITMNALLCVWWEGHGSSAWHCM